MNKFVSTLLVACICLASVSSLLASDQPATASLVPTKVALFKNGYAYITQEAKLGKATQVELSGLPVPSHGTLWWSVTGDVQVKHLVTSAKMVDVPAPLSIRALLASNVGKIATLTVQVGTSLPGAITGTILPQPMIKTPSGNMLAPHEGGIPTPTPVSSTVLIKTTAGATVAIEAHTISSLSIEGDMVPPTAKMGATAITATLLGKPEGQTLTTTCVSYGITWAPSYKIDISQPKQAQLQAQATIINELMDMENVTAELTTGFPAVKYAALPAPLSLKQTLEQFINFDDSNPSTNRRSPMLTQNRAVSNIAFVDADPFAKGEMSSGFDIGMGASPYEPAKTFTRDDLSFYPLSPFTCKKGETVTTSLFSLDTPYEHIYTVEIPAVNANVYYNDNNQQPTTPIETWHCLRFTNNGKQPLTTAPIEFINQGNLVGQSMLDYTPVGKKATVKINKALNCITKRNEKLSKRVEGERDFFGNAYYIYTIEGEITFLYVAPEGEDKQAPISTEIGVQMRGTVESTSSDGKISQALNAWSSENPASSIKWNISATPEKEVKLNYTFTFKQRR